MFDKNIRLLVLTIKLYISRKQKMERRSRVGYISCWKQSLIKYKYVIAGRKRLRKTHEILELIRCRNGLFYLQFGHYRLVVGPVGGGATFLHTKKRRAHAQKCRGLFATNRIRYCERSAPNEGALWYWLWECACVWGWVAVESIANRRPIML